MDVAELPVVYLNGGRSCFGLLIIEEEALHFLCLVDESAAAANTGQAVSRQFGLVGALVGAAVSGVKESRRKKQLATALEAHQGLAVDQRVALHPLSRTLWVADVRALKFSRSLQPQLLTTGQPLLLPQLTPALKEALEAWCAQAGVAIEAVKPISRRTKLILALSPLALAAVFLLAAVPFAVQRSALVTGTLARYDRLVAQAEAAVQAPPGGGSADCGEALKGITTEQVVAWVGPLPEGTSPAGKDYYGFPRVVSVHPGHSKWSSRRVEHEWTVQRWRPTGSFSESYGRVLSNTPEWGMAARSLGTLPNLTGARVALVARVVALRAPPHGGTARSGRARLAVQVVDFDTWAPRCTREVEVVFPPRDSAVRDADFHVAHSISKGVLLSVCHLVGPARDNTTELCALAAESATLVGPGAGLAGHPPIP